MKTRRILFSVLFFSIVLTQEHMDTVKAKWEKNELFIIC